MRSEVTSNSIDLWMCLHSSIEWTKFADIFSRYGSEAVR